MWVACRLCDWDMTSLHGVMYWEDGDKNYSICSHLQCVKVKSTEAQKYWSVRIHTTQIWSLDTTAHFTTPVQWVIFCGWCVSVLTRSHNRSEIQTVKIVFRYAYCSGTVLSNFPNLDQCITPVTVKQHADLVLATSGDHTTCSVYSMGFAVNVLH